MDLEKTMRSELLNLAATLETIRVRLVVIEGSARDEKWYAVTAMTEGARMNVEKARKDILEEIRVSFPLAVGHE